MTEVRGPIGAELAPDRIPGYIQSVATARDIIPITRLKNEASELIRTVAEDGRTLIVTQNGTAKAVLLDIAEYDRLQETMALLKIIAQGQADVRSGRVCSVDEAFDAAERAIDSADDA